MKFPSHVLLDVEKTNPTTTTQYWVLTFLTKIATDSTQFHSYTFHRKFYSNPENYLLPFSFRTQKKFTIRTNYTNPALFISDFQKEMLKNLFQPATTVKRRNKYAKSYTQQIYSGITTKNKPTLDKIFFKQTVDRFSFTDKNTTFAENRLWRLFDINFLRKERIYTKLKYSRVPQYDIVSGGVAAIFAGFLGFLIAEKFGFEMLDSGDFYYLLMYVVFFSFFCRLFTKITTNEYADWNAFSYKWFVFFYRDLIILVFNFFTKLASK